MSDKIGFFLTTKEFALFKKVEQKPQLTRGVTCHRALARMARRSRLRFPPPGSHVYRALLAADAVAVGRESGRWRRLRRPRRGFAVG